MTTTKITDSTFEQDVLQAQGPVLVDFWAEWCGPCKMIGPLLDELARDKGTQVTIAKMNVDDNPMIPSKYGVRSIPTLILFKGGKPIATKIGALPKSSLYAWVETELSNSEAA